MYTKHPVFNEPTDENTPIWRYLDFTKFVALLNSNSLWFSRADKLGDPFEGSYPNLNVEHRYDFIPVDIKYKENMKNAYKRIQECTFLNCWHSSEYESVAMWKTYSNSDEGIAIKSSFKKLTSSFDETYQESIFVGIVNYIDYKNEWFPENNALYPFVHKRKSFEYEKEVRAVISLLKNIDPKNQNDILGLNVPINLKKMIDSIYISPESPDWFFELVKSVLYRYSLREIPVEKSSLTEDPLF